MKRIAVVMAAMAMFMVVAGPAFAHELVITHPGSGEVVRQQWVGGDTVPAPAQDAGPMFGPFSLPPSHGAGLVSACEGTGASPAATFLAPPFFTGCHHGAP